MKNEPRYIHFVLHGLEKTVVDSQLIEPALRLGEQGIPISLLVMEDLLVWLGLFNSERMSERQRRVKGLTLVTLPRVPRNFLWLNTFLLFLTTARILLRGGRLVVHARGLQGAATWLPIKKVFSQVRLICDVRGIEWDEYGYSISEGGRIPLNRAQLWWRGKLERLGRDALLGADVIFCVSHAMREALMEQTGLSDGERWIYVPCSTAVEKFDIGRQSRGEIRRGRGWENRLVVVYSGAFRRWQMPEESVRCAAIMKKINPAVFLYCLTPDVGAFRSLTKAQGFNDADCLVEHRSFDAMPEALSAGDIGLLLRENTPLNRYACPTKFAEYLAAGLTVLTTAAIEDIADFVRDHYVGSILNSAENPAAIETQLISDLKILPTETVRISRSVEAARASFDWSAYIPVLKKWYLELGDRS